MKGRAMKESVCSLLFDEDSMYVALRKFEVGKSLYYTGFMGDKLPDNVLEYTAYDTLLLHTNMATNPEHWRSVVTLTGDQEIVHYMMCRSPNLFSIQVDNSFEVFSCSRLPVETVAPLIWVIPLCCDDGISKPLNILR